MTLRTAGIHHITSFVTDPQRNVDFYAGILGLRMVKQTINFDAPEVYHLYFGNEGGSPGTIVTFFPQPGSRKGVIGAGQLGITVFAVPPGALPFWEERLNRLNIHVEKAERFGEQLLRFTDYDGLRIELAERKEGAASTWEWDGITSAQAIKGFGGGVLFSGRPERTLHTIEHVLGLTRIGEEDGYVRFKADGDIGNIIDVNSRDLPRGIGGAGTVHHIAWRAADFAEHEQWREQVEAAGFQPTPVIDRQYFHAVYFREDGGILFEIATDPPGFANDETAEQMGSKLMLPEWYEPQRELIQSNLLPIQVRKVEGK
ncbi:ring-cleaving dioxygenase [Paenibacillus dauci]|uniref:ring-cleaving dioxygenase n=1 Tax=Paenibacillus dauci TaxID=1567106 RepID=UPI000619F87F|nr:ring-cleaving dioxygenase [Paenibacillus dauci]